MARKELGLAFPETVKVKTLHIKYKDRLSPLAKLILKSFRSKYFYYVVEDILYLLKSNTKERDSLLQMLHSIVIYLQNNLCVNFFDIWVYEIYINEVSQYNNLVNRDFRSLEPLEYITIKLAYQVKPPTEKVEIPW